MGEVFVQLPSPPSTPVSAVAGGRGASPATHLCVLVHGLYGHPPHLDYIAEALRARYGEEQLHILNVKNNTGNLTYDGIELGGERVAHEIEEHVAHLEAQGCRIRQLSIVGYSLGGLISRYAIGLLYARGYFQEGRIQPVNFTTFATPHVGVRNPARRNHLWNVIGARTISTSGRQLFMIDHFRGTGAPLLSLLATKGSIFMLGLAKFQHRTLYANVVNDKAAVYYTTSISTTDPFAVRRDEGIVYVRGYEPVVVDPERPYSEPYSASGPPGGVRAATSAAAWSVERVGSTAIHHLRQIPFYLYLALCVPVGSIVYLLNSFFQTILSRKRIQLHEQRRVSTMFCHYDIPLTIEHMRNATSGLIDEMYESIDTSQPAEYLSDDSSEQKWEQRQQHSAASPSAADTLAGAAGGVGTQTSTSVTRKTRGARTLALTPAQFEIIDSLDALGFRKFPVYIHKARHSHAAIIFRMSKPEYEEGKLVIKHWLDNEFHLE
ncbi:hypothetical protein KEM52_002641 [Ascosphaera acerosa]|nr:hypothetical protein KEM52_002641 [Ascosphaera acerosa]